MKKSVFIFVIVTFNFALSNLNCFAQPNGGFENWTPEFSYENPDGWQTFNFLSLTSPPNPLSAFKAIGIDAHSGNYALELKTIFISNNPNPGVVRDSFGYVFTGKISPSPFSYLLGYPYTGRPEKLEFWAKYAPVGGDEARAGVTLAKWNGISHDTIAVGKINIPVTPAYSLFEVTLNYRLTDLPDSATIYFASSKDNINERVGSTLFIDDVAFTGWVGIDEQNQYSDKVQVFPNPAKDDITILAQIDEADNVQLIDAMGKLVGIYKIQKYTAIINTSLFPAAIYFYEIRDKKNSVLTKGKFNVVK